MHKRRYTTTYFVLFALVCLLLLIFSSTAIIQVSRFAIEFVTKPIGIIFHTNSEDKMTTDPEKDELLKKLAYYQQLEKDTKALRDQFETAQSKTVKLLPAQVVAMPQFIPGLSEPSYFVIDKGSSDNIKKGQGVVVKDMVVGKIQEVSPSLSQVVLVTNQKISLTAKTVRNNALGIVKGNENGEMILENVLLSEDLQKDDVVVTSGDISVQGIGLPANFVLGKIVSVEKKPSALFQTAKVKSMIDLSKMSTVFVIVGLQ